MKRRRKVLKIEMTPEMEKACAIVTTVADEFRVVMRKGEIWVFNPHSIQFMPKVKDGYLVIVFKQFLDQKTTIYDRYKNPLLRSRMHKGDREYCERKRNSNN